MKMPALALLLLLGLLACVRGPGASAADEPPAPAKAGSTEPPAPGPDGKVHLSEAQWKERLSPEQFRILREAGTERAHTGPFLDEHREGRFHCAGCGLALYPSETKFDSGTGWPSFWAPVEGAVETTVDRTLGMARTELHCARCGGHLGHVFSDGPKPTGQRHCINGGALTFEAAGPAR